MAVVHFNPDEFSVWSLLSNDKCSEFKPELYIYTDEEFSFWSSIGGRVVIWCFVLIFAVCILAAATIYEVKRKNREEFDIS